MQSITRKQTASGTAFNLTGATAPSFKPSRTIMKPTYIVKFNTLNDQETWSRIEFTSISKALGFVSLFVKRGSICKIFQK